MTESIKSIALTIGEFVIEKIRNSDDDFSKKILDELLSNKNLNKPQIQIFFEQIQHTIVRHDK